MLLDIGRFILGTIVAGALSIMCIHLGMEGFILARIEAEPVAFAVYTLLAFLSGALAFGMASVPHYRSKIKRLEEEHGKDMDEKDERIAKLTDGLERLKYDYDNLVEANEGDPAHDALCQDILDAIKKIRNSDSQIEQYVREQIDGGILQNVSFGEAFNDLIKYGCVSGCPLHLDEAGRYRFPQCSFGYRLLNERFPSFLNRKLKDNEVEPMTAEDVIRAFEEGSRLAELERSRHLAI